MSSNPLRPPRILLLLVILIVASAVGRLAQRGAAAAETRPSATAAGHIYELQIQRRDLLRQLAKVTEASFGRGEASPDDLADTVLALHEAELDLSRTATERLRVHEQLLEKMREFEKRANAAAAAGWGTTDLLKAKARRLRAEIGLEQAKLAGA